LFERPGFPYEFGYGSSLIAVVVGAEDAEVVAPLDFFDAKDPIPGHVHHLTATIVQVAFSPSATLKS